MGIQKQLFGKSLDNREVFLYEITNKNVTYEQLLENIYKLNENEQIDDIWYMVYNYYKNQNDYQNCKLFEIYC